MATNNRQTKVYGRLSYATLFTPRAANDNAAAKYSATILIPKDDTDTIQRVNQAIHNAVDNAVERHTFTKPINAAATKYPPLRDGDQPNENGESRGPEYAGHWFIAAKAPTSRKPFVVDEQVQPVMDENEVYSGCYCNFAIEFYGYENSGNKGISASLLGVQKVKDGDRLGGSPAEATDFFTAVDNNGSVAGLGF